MEFIKFKKANIIQENCIDEFRQDWRITFAIRNYTPTEEESQEEIVPDCEALCGIIVGIPSDWHIKHLILEAQSWYDKSKEVNSFIINGELAWLDKATRVGLMNSISILEEAEVENYTLWLNDKPYTMPISIIKNLLKDLEVYAMQCNNVTEQHIAEIKLLENRQDLLNYQIHTNYPPKVEIVV